MANKLTIRMVTPEGKKKEDQAEILNVVTTSGAMGILPKHLPLVAVLEISHLNYRNGGKLFEYSISGGVMHVKKDEVLLLLESFESKDEIDFVRADKSRKRAEERLALKGPDIDVRRAEISLKRALNRLNMK